MKLTSSTVLLSLLASPIAAWHKRLNIGGNNPDGPCKSYDDWIRAFNTMKSIPPAFSSARPFAASDCNTLANAVPAAVNTGVKLLIGVMDAGRQPFQRREASCVGCVGEMAELARLVARSQCRQ